MTMKYDDEDILLKIGPCIPFATQMFPHHGGIFLQALCELEPSSMEMNNQKHILCLNDFSDGELSTVNAGEKNAGEKPATGECGSPKNSGFLPDASHSHSRYNQLNSMCSLPWMPTMDALVAVYTTTFQDAKDRDFLNPLYPHDEGDSVRDKVHAHGPKYTQFPVLQFVLIKADGYEQGTHMYMVISWKLHVFKNTMKYNLIIGQELMQDLRILLDFKNQTVIWDEVTIPMRDPETSIGEGYEIHERKVLYEATEQTKSLGLTTLECFGVDADGW